ncbi:hypothetical protein [Reichenbachiella sp. MALMAid0571]|uniref:hypothetical protein n=1 Tax=Reichenbachiella sp. MALMAid0571 TaxID=3143939 RepID=UPI0032E031B6
MVLNQDTAEARVRFPFPPPNDNLWGNGVRGMHVALILNIYGEKKRGLQPLFLLSENS